MEVQCFGNTTLTSPPSYANNQMVDIPPAPHYHTSPHVPLQHHNNAGTTPPPHITHHHHANTTSASCNDITTAGYGDDSVGSGGYEWPHTTALPPHYTTPMKEMEG